MNIEDVLSNRDGILKKDNSGTYVSKIIDAELDVFDCTFNNDDCVEIDTDGFNYITLSKDALYKLIELIEETNKRYKK